jgi:hypothetical protein
MKYVYVKDNEGFAIKKLASDALANEEIITKQEYNKITSYDLIIKRFSKQEASKIFEEIKQEVEELQKN